MDLQTTESASFRGRLGTTQTVLQRRFLRHFGQQGSNRWYVSHPTNRSGTFHEQSTFDSRLLRLWRQWATNPKSLSLGRDYSHVPLSSTYQSPSSLTKQWRYAQQLAAQQWNRLQKEYKESYPSLNPRQKWTAVSKPLNPGYVVWILWAFTPRCLWPLGHLISPVSHGKEVELSEEDQYRQYKERTPRGEQVIPTIRLSALQTSEWKMLKIIYSQRDKERIQSYLDMNFNFLELNI